MDRQSVSVVSPNCSGYERLHEFNFLPSRYIHPHQASMLLPAAWCSRLAENQASPRIHMHLSTYLLQRLQIANAWVHAADTFATKLALQATSTLNTLMYQLGLVLVGQPIRQCVRREQIQQLDAALTLEDWEFVFHAATLNSPSVRGIEDALFASPRETIMDVGRAALQQLTATLDDPARVRLDLKIPALSSTAPLPALEQTVPEESLVALSQALLNELEPAWEMTFSGAST